MKKLIRRLLFSTANKGIEEVKTQYNWYSKFLKFFVYSISVLTIILMISVVIMIVIASFSIL